jgi:hypothetical protein
MFMWMLHELKLKLLNMKSRQNVYVNVTQLKLIQENVCVNVTWIKTIN